MRIEGARSHLETNALKGEYAVELINWVNAPSGGAVGIKLTEREARSLGRHLIGLADEWLSVDYHDLEPGDKFTVNDSVVRMKIDKKYYVWLGPEGQYDPCVLEADPQLIGKVRKLVG